MTKEVLKAKFKKYHSRINYMYCSIFPVVNKCGKVTYWVKINNSNYLYKNKKDALKVFFNAVKKYLDK